MFFNKIGTFIAMVILATSVNLSAFAKDCGITNDASLPDCQYLIANYPSAPNFGNKCHYYKFPLFHDAFDTACHGTCCIYSDQNGVSRDLVLQGAQAVLSNCAGSNTVNGRSKLPGGSGGATICLSDGNGCGGCFA